MKMRMMWFLMFAAIMFLAACEGRLPGGSALEVEVTRVVEVPGENVEVTRVTVLEREVTRVVEVTAEVVLEDPTPTGTPEPTGTPVPVDTPEAETPDPVAENAPVTVEMLLGSHPDWMLEAYSDHLEANGLLITNEDIVLVSPEMDEEQSHPPQSGLGSFDIGVMDGQIGVVVGVYVNYGPLEAGDPNWEDRQDDSGTGCALVGLMPGFYQDLAIVDGRYIVYHLPERDQDGWANVLVEQWSKMQEQAYDCPEGIKHAEAWSADPYETSWESRRRQSGEDFLIPFYEGDTVFGFSVYRGEVEYEVGVGHEGDLVCDGGNCYLPEAPWDGWCGGCWVNSWWPGELETIENATPIDLVD